MYKSPIWQQNKQNHSLFPIFLSVHHSNKNCLNIDSIRIQISTKSNDLRRYHEGYWWGAHFLATPRNCCRRLVGYYVSLFDDLVFPHLMLVVGVAEFVFVQSKKKGISKHILLVWILTHRNLYFRVSSSIFCTKNDKLFCYFVDLPKNNCTWMDISYGWANLCNYFERIIIQW